MEVLSGKKIFGPRLNMRRGSHVKTHGECIMDGGKSWCKGPEVGTAWLSHKEKEARVAGAKGISSRRKDVG